MLHNGILYISCGIQIRMENIQIEAKFNSGGKGESYLVTGVDTVYKVKVKQSLYRSG